MFPYFLGSRLDAPDGWRIADTAVAQTDAMLRVLSTACAATRPVCGTGVHGILGRRIGGKSPGARRTARPSLQQPSTHWPAVGEVAGVK